MFLSVVQYMHSIIPRISLFFFPFMVLVIVRIMMQGKSEKMVQVFSATRAFSLLLFPCFWAFGVYLSLDISFWRYWSFKLKFQCVIGEHQKFCLAEFGEDRLSISRDTLNLRWGNWFSIYSLRIIHIHCSQNYSFILFDVFSG